MRTGRIVCGISLFGASCWLAPTVSDLLGVSHLFGFVTLGGLMAFAGGAVFHSGVTGWRHTF